MGRAIILAISFVLLAFMESLSFTTITDPNKITYISNTDAYYFTCFNLTKFEKKQDKTNIIIGVIGTYKDSTLNYYMDINLPKAICGFRNILYFTYMEGMKGINVVTGTVTFDAKNNFQQLTDLCASENAVYGFKNKILYSFGDNYYELNIPDKFVSISGFGYNPVRKQIIGVIGSVKSRIISFDPKTKQFADILQTNIKDMVEVCCDNEGNVYICSWGDQSNPATGLLYKYDKDFSGEPEIIADSLFKPIDIAYNTKRNEIAVLQAGAKNITIVDLDNYISTCQPIDEEDSTQTKSLMPTFKWKRVKNAENYTLQFFADKDTSIFKHSKSELLTIIDESNPDIEINNIKDTIFTFTAELNPQTKYLWRIRANATKSTGPWSKFYSFTTSPQTGINNQNYFSNMFEISDLIDGNYFLIRSPGVNLFSPVSLNCSIFSLNSVLIKSEDIIFDSSYKISLNQINSGLYFVLLSSNSKDIMIRQTKKFIKID